MIGVWTLKRCENYMRKVVSKDFKIESYHKGKGKDYIQGYVVTDAYRPTMKWYARTPAEALRLAGVWLPKKSFGY